ncbi:guanine nucleotide exchange factor LTE1 [Podospora aff. communis PSN243]|uniref:Guanine nucleotide exchange factor LTE1 n=1 Tax=Podospora aff. communis PSN243 TaxID=3040156 RepID=A0AAV9H086_9PEZI|nr:guanine nucleotide exchange factor LTE1 [Podospora aff. communis PSN243]
MDAEPPPASPATALTARFRQQLLAQRQRAERQTGPREPSGRRRTPKLGRGDGDKEPGGTFTTFGSSGIIGRAPTRTASGAQQRPLLPVSERRSQEENVLQQRRAKKGSQDDDKWDLTPDGGSAGREGRQFAVANVGNNGRIYLRPTVRPANQRYPQPHFVFPMTPPGTAGLDALAPGGSGQEVEGSTGFREDSRWDASSPSISGHGQPGGKTTGNRTRHRRAMSDSTVPDTSIARESEPGGFKIVITQPGEEQRPKTTEDMALGNPPLLEVSIPSWRIGTPRFSIRGTPFIRGSSYAPTEDVRSSTASFFGRSPMATMNNSKRPSPDMMLPAIHVAGADPEIPPRISGPVFPRPLRATTYMSTHLVIEPAMFDALTFKPACDDRSIVRYSSTGAVTAATPPRLVAEITSPSFLDYELLSDFFLTFRSFLETSDLLRMLFARLRWALARSDEAGMVVRVRTFVALRHWILNYFIDDFVIDYSLRVMFCNLLNDFVDELAQDLRARKVQLKILAELKKCWRRVCGLYWDGPDFDTSLAPDIPILPGGIAGHRDPNLDPAIWITDDGPPQIDGVVTASYPARTSLYAEVSRAGHIDSIVVGDRPGTPENRGELDLARGPTSPTSIASVDVVSCSFPTKTMRFAHPGAHPLAAHPADPNSMHSSTDPIAMTPRALVGKRVRPQQSHKRNGSLSDSMREHATTTEKMLFKNAEFLLALPLAGSLVRGNMFPPGQPYVEVVPPSGAAEPARQTTLFQPQPTEAPKEKIAASAMSGQGMRRLLGSVRRALSTKGQGVSPTHGNFINISPIGPRGATVNRLPGTAIVPQARPHQHGVRPPVRIDLLGAEVAEDFKRAVREDAALEAENNGDLSPPPPVEGSKVPGELLEYSAEHMGTSFVFSDDMDVRPISDMAITTGSKSIVIVDDTVLPDSFPSMTGALPAMNSSVEAFTDTFMQNVADPTPPNTPPGRPMGTPRRSSYILSQQILRSSLGTDSLPPFIPDMETLGRNGRASEDSHRPSFDLPLPRSRPPLSGIHGHSRQRSSRSYHSSRSIGHRRYASFTSGIVPQPTIRSFDATTYSEASLDDSSQVMVPQPLRVLRRRPGGDLRAVANAGDLDPATLRRSRSVGSLTTYTESLRSSYMRSPGQDSSGFVDVLSTDFSSTRRGEAFSLGAIAEQNPKRGISLFSTHSSKPIMRPSFEAEAQKLAQIPDDVDDDGGVESALLKLEGKYEKKTPARLSIDLQSAAPETTRPETAAGAPEGTVVSMDEKREHRNVHVVEAPHVTSTVAADVDLQTNLLGVDIARSGDVLSFLSEDSRGSYTSIPLLDRGLTDDGRSRKTVTREWTDRSILQGPDEGLGSSANQTPRDSQHPSYEFVNKTDSLEQIELGNTLPVHDQARMSAEQSFLDVESDDGTDLSSELSMEVIDSRVEGDGVSPTKIGIAVSTLPGHPLAESPTNLQISSSPSPNPPSPPITLIQALDMNPPDTVEVPVVQDHQVWEKPLPPTPDTTPTTTAAPYTQYPIVSPTDPTGTKEALRNAPRLEIPDPIPQEEPIRNRFAVHLPFILAFDSDILAQQFTLIEKDALNEVDWKELIDMRWKNAEQNGINSRSWVSFLRDTDARGVEVVIARFNIMVKWAISEIVLTQEIEERARCMIKFIHIAAHCRKYRNFATMAQLTIALTSNEIGRLTKTWAMVPASDQRTMADLEALMSPTRNFYNLRAEMEGGGSVGTAIAEMGCIPFVGIYTHDLLFNAQRPIEIASSPTTAPLVNFERCRTSASVVKTLLRLLESSSLYTFQPIEGITERCLWMGALTDEEIRRLGESLE